MFGCATNNKQANMDTTANLSPIDYSITDLADTYSTLAELTNDSTFISGICKPINNRGF
ncbi:hypothetical protein D3C77_790730 [compost metagenome]